MFTVKVEINSFDDLYDMCWSQAKDTLKTIADFNMEDELMEHLTELFSDYDSSDTSINDYLAYELDEYDFVADNINIEDVEDLDELEDIYKKLYHSVNLYDFKQENKEKELWEYIQDNYAGYTLKEVREELEDLTVDDIA